MTHTFNSAKEQPRGFALHRSAPQSPTRSVPISPELSSAFLPPIAPNLDQLISSCRGIQASVKSDKASIKRSVTIQELKEKKFKEQLEHKNLNFFKYHQQYQLGKKKLANCLGEGGSNQLSQTIVRSVLSPQREVKKLLSFDQLRAGNTAKLLNRNKREFGQGFEKELKSATDGEMTRKKQVKILTAWSPRGLAGEGDLGFFDYEEVKRNVEVKKLYRKGGNQRYNHYRISQVGDGWNTPGRRKQQFKALTTKSKVALIFSKSKTRK